jgi:hypothetical protein
MIATLSKPVRLALGLTLLIMPPGAMYAFVASPLLDTYRLRQEEIEDMRHRTGRYTQIAQGVRELEQQLAVLRRAGGDTDGYLDGANETLVGAALQSRVKAAVEDVGGDVRSSQILPGRDEASSRRITVRIHAMQTIDALARTLAGFATDRSVLLVDQLDVRARPVAQETGGREPARLLEVRLDISGFMKSRAP